jgi:hypothetical protein
MPPPMTTTAARGGTLVSDATGSTFGPMISALAYS